MPASTVLGLTASAWAIMMALAPLLQVREIRARGSSSGISAATYRVLLVGFGLWAAYGVAEREPRARRAEPGRRSRGYRHARRDRALPARGVGPGRDDL